MTDNPLWDNTPGESFADKLIFLVMQANTPVQPPHVNRASLIATIRDLEKAAEKAFDSWLETAFGEVEPKDVCTYDCTTCHEHEDDDE